MERRRSWIVIVIVVLVLIALVARRTGPPARAAPAAPPAVAAAAAEASGIERVSISEDRTTLRGLHADGTTAFTYTIEDWRAWAEDHLEEQLGEMVMIGDQQMPPDRFDMFGAAEPSPDGELVAFTTTAYAMLTTVSVLGILDAESLTLEVVREPAFGGADELVWSPDGRFIAYPLGTARAAGDALRIDDVRQLRPASRLEASDVLAAAVRQGIPVRVEEHEWLPMFREPSWTPAGRLLITTNDPALGEADGRRRWSVTPDASVPAGE